MSSFNPIMCLLCQGLLPPDDKDVFINHVKDQHRVFSSIEFIMVASQLEVKEMLPVIKFMENIKENRKTNKSSKVDADAHEQKIDELEPKGTEVIMNENDIKTDISNYLDCKLEVKENPCIKEDFRKDTEKSLKKRRGLKKGASFRGSLDRKTKIILGTCKCPLCKKEFSITDFLTERLYRRHVYTHGTRRFDCECKKTWQTVKDFKLHIYTSHRGNFHCDSCRCVLQTEEEYETHKSKHANKEPLVCDDCGFVSLNDQTFYSHVRYHHDKETHVCDICSREFNGSLKLKMHIRRFHGEKKPCTLCGQMVKSMWIHKKTMHTNDSDKKYKCDHCTKGFVEKGKLEIHMTSVHIKNRPFVCRYECGAASNEKGNRKKHEIAKHGQAWPDFTKFDAASFNI